MSVKFGEIPVKANVAISAALIALNVLLYIAIPIWVLPRSLWLAVGLSVLIVVASNTFWAIIHEAIHAKILPSSRWNDTLGRSLCVCFGSPYQLLRFGHLMHHKFNRSPIDRVEVVEDAPSKAATLNYYVKLLGGLYLLELIVAPTSLLPKPMLRGLVMTAFGAEAPDGRTMRIAAEAQLLEGPGYGQMQFDGLLITGMLAVSFWLYGAFWWLLASALLGRAFLISFFDNAYHYGNALDDVLAGYNLKLPVVLERSILNFNMHATHHRHPRVPWSMMPTLFRQDEEAYQFAYFPAAARQLRGMIGWRTLSTTQQLHSATATQTTA